MKTKQNKTKIGGDGPGYDENSDPNYVLPNPNPNPYYYITKNKQIEEETKLKVLGIDQYKDQIFTSIRNFDSVQVNFEQIQNDFFYLNEIPDNTQIRKILSYYLKEFDDYKYSLSKIINIIKQNSKNINYWYVFLNKIFHTKEDTENFIQKLTLNDKQEYILD